MARFDCGLQARRSFRDRIGYGNADGVEAFCSRQRLDQPAEFAGVQKSSSA
jgi:hypothetical protein